MLHYFEECYMLETSASLEHVRAIFSRNEAFTWTMRSEGLPLLHLAAMNEVTEPEELAAVIRELLRHGAPPDAKDEDGDAVLEAVMLQDEDGEALSDSAKLAHLAAVRELLQCPELTVGSAEVQSVCAWLTSMPQDCWQQVLSDLEARAGKAEVMQAWASEELFQYVSESAYEEKRGVEAKRVRHYLEQGAAPGHTKNGASALLLIVLNPYSTYEELLQVFQLMISKDPNVPTVRDGFRLTPLQWASDYTNVAQQHGLDRPNPAALLALLPILVALLPPGVDAGEICFKVSPGGRCGTSGGRPLPNIRFLEGDRVLCRVEAPGGVCVWEEGVVVGLWYREGCWPQDHPGAPYEVLLDLGSRVFALADDDRIVRREGQGRPPTFVSNPETKSSRPASGKAPAAGAGPRFQKRQGGEGKWELLDTVSGKARPCSPPDSDED